MPVLYGSLVHELSTTTGTGNLVLSNVNGKQSFNTAFGTGATTNVFEGFISNRDVSSQWERSLCHLSNASTLVRDTLIESSTGTSINFGDGTKDVVNDVGPDVQANNGSNLVNRLINGEGRVWQTLNTGSSVVTDATYVWDQWYALTQLGSTGSSAHSITASSLTNVENGTPYMMRLTQASATSQRIGLAQFIEAKDCIDMRGKTVSLSARVRMSVATTLRFAILEGTGAADSPTRDVVNTWTSGTFTAGNFFGATTAVTITGSLALASSVLTDVWVRGTVSSNANNVGVFFWSDGALAQNATLDIAKAQLEIGSVPTAYARTPAQEEFLRCLRFYQKSWVQATPPRTDNADGGAGLTFIILGTNELKPSQFYGNVCLPTPLRAVTASTYTVYPYATASTDSAKVSAPNGAAVQDKWESGGTAVPSSGTPAWVTEHGFVVYNGNSGTTALTLGLGVMFHYTADARFT